MLMPTLISIIMLGTIQVGFQVASSVSELHHKDNFSLIHLNCRRLFYKLSDIQLLVEQTNATVVAVSETWLNSDLVPSVVVPGYSFVSRCRNGSKVGVMDFL